MGSILFPWYIITASPSLSSMISLPLAPAVCTEIVSEAKVDIEVKLNIGTCWNCKEPEEVADAVFDESAGSQLEHWITEDQQLPTPTEQEIVPQHWSSELCEPVIACCIDLRVTSFFEVLFEVVELNLLPTISLIFISLIYWIFTDWSAYWSIINNFI